MARLFDSVAPDVKMISFGSAPIKSATYNAYMPSDSAHKTPSLVLYIPYWSQSLII